VKQLILLHHDPERDDAAVTSFQSEARLHFPNTYAAMEGFSGAYMMLSDMLLAELEQEAVATRRLLDRMPDDKLAWKPHVKS
jgi:hypothetical protein